MRILLIEDNASLSYILKRDLEALGFSTTVAEDGEKGLYHCENWSYDIILLDVNLPVMDGWSVLERLRKNHATPVIMLTANDSLDDRIKGLSHGADDYLCKPFHFKELVARIMALHRRSVRAVENNCIQIGDCTLHLDTTELYKDGEATPLTPREFDILLTLSKQRGKIVSRDTIFHLFAENETPSLASLDVHICNLRKKLGAQKIKTIRGKGYLLDL